MEARLDAEESSMTQTPCKTSVEFTVNNRTMIGAPTATYVGNRLQVVGSTDPQCLDSDLPPLIITPRHVPEPPPVQHNFSWIVVVQLNPQRCGGHRMMSTYLV